MNQRKIWEKQTSPIHCELSMRALEWMNGELLGDGCLRACTSYSAKFRYGSKHLEYIDYVSGTLNAFGIKQSGKIYKRATGVYHYDSCSYYKLSFLRKAWYPEGKKEVPRGLKLTPLVCRQWYIGDGCLVKSVRYNPTIILCTTGFPVSDVEWLVKQLWEIGILATRQHAQNVVSISRCSSRDFLHYIGECPVKCYRYKWGC